MKQKIQYAIVTCVIGLSLTACTSNKTGEQVSDSLNQVTDSVKNDTSTYDITSQKDSLGGSTTDQDTVPR
ncbi:hypothetical protein [Arcticibacter sp. MXS-1]|uniref:hypothetical protein n=1 Tax=Arcticibacter sp. MXS-1 TaxID=3341726 RepID=UPI0035A953FB